MPNKLQELKEKLAALRPLNATETARLREQFAIENTYNSNAIEGSTLTLRETALVLQEGITIAQKPLKEHLEAIGHKDAIDFVEKIATPNTSLTESDILQIHSLVLMHDRENKGIYRRVPVRILGSAHTPPQPYAVAAKMEQLLAEYETQKTQSNIIEKIAEFHLRFEGIHPFIDGNGRTGRLIMNLELLKHGYLPIDIKYADKQRYYDCFDEYCSGANSAKAMVDLITEYEIAELKNRIAIIESIN